MKKFNWQFALVVVATCAFWVLVAGLLSGCDASNATREVQFCREMNYVRSAVYDNFCYDPETDQYFNINKLKANNPAVDQDGEQSE